MKWNSRSTDLSSTLLGHLTSHGLFKSQLLTQEGHSGKKP